MTIEAEHAWFRAEFNYGSWIECNCGFRPDSQLQMDTHIPSDKPVFDLSSVSMTLATDLDRQKEERLLSLFGSAELAAQYKDQYFVEDHPIEMTFEQDGDNYVLHVQQEFRIRKKSRGE